MGWSQLGPDHESTKEAEAWYEMMTRMAVQAARQKQRAVRDRAHLPPASPDPNAFGNSPRELAPFFTATSTEPPRAGPRQRPGVCRLGGCDTAPHSDRGRPVRDVGGWRIRTQGGPPQHARPHRPRAAVAPPAKRSCICPAHTNHAIVHIAKYRPRCQRKTRKRMRGPFSLGSTSPQCSEACRGGRCGRMRRSGTPRRWSPSRRW